jgi:hypothetical protein
MLALILLACATPAYGGETGQPWSGGEARASAFERSASVIVHSLVGGPVSLECATPDHWRRLAAREGFDPATTWAMTPLHLQPGESAASPDGRTDLSPRACRLASAFSAAPSEMGSRICRHGSTTQWRAVAATPGDQRAPRRRVRVPLLGECDDWGSKLVAVHVIGHETMHLAGVVDEAAADCLALQLDAYVAVRLGATASFARSLAREYWRIYYPAQDARYRSSQCRDGSALDLFPDRTGWPTPSRYPADVAGAVLSSTRATRAAGTREVGRGDL